MNKAQQKDSGRSSRISENDNKDSARSPNDEDMGNADKPLSDNGIPFGLIDDVDYKYCYRSMLIEAKEWYQTLKNLESYLSGKRESQQEKAKDK